MKLSSVVRQKTHALIHVIETTHSLLIVEFSSTSLKINSQFWKKRSVYCSYCAWDLTCYLEKIIIFSGNLWIKHLASGWDKIRRRFLKTVGLIINYFISWSLHLLWTSLTFFWQDGFFGCSTCCGQCQLLYLLTIQSSGSWN